MEMCYGIISHPDGLDVMVEAGAIIRMIGIIFSAPGHQNGFHNRLQLLLS